MATAYGNRKNSGKNWKLSLKRAGAILATMMFGITLPDFLAASGGGSPSRSSGGAHSHGHRGGGPSIGIGIQLGPRAPVGDSGPDFDKVERDLNQSTPAFTDSDDEDKPKRKPVAKAVEQIPPTRKLPNPRVPYLFELAMDIDRTLVDLAANEPAKAVLLYKSALAQAKKRGDLQAERDAMANLATVYYLTGQLTRAKENYLSGLAIIQKIKAPQEEAVGLRNLAAVLTAAGEYDEAEAKNREALQIFEQEGNSKSKRMVLNNLGVLEKNRGRTFVAVENYRQALEVDKEQDRPSSLTLNNLGNVSRARGAYQKSLDYFKKALEAARTAGNPREQGEILLNISRVYWDWGRSDQALESAREAMEVLSKAGAPTDWAKKLMADMYLELGKPEKAEPLAREAEYDSTLGWLYLVKQDPEHARKQYELLLASSQKAGNLDELFTAYTGLGKAYEALKNYKQSEVNYAKAVDIGEEIRSSLLLSERKNFFAAKINGFPRSEPAKGLVRVTLKQNKPSESVLPSEASRAREFADILSQKAEGASFGVPQTTLEREAHLANRFASLKTSLPLVSKAADQERFQEISKEITKLTSEKTAFTESLWRDHKDYASVRYPKPVKLENAALGPEEYVIVFDLLGDVLGVRVIKGKKIVDAYLADWSDKELEEAVANFRKTFESAQLKTFNADLALRLFNNLLDRPLQKIPPGTRVTIIPDGVLALLPFEVLVTKGRAEWKEGSRGAVPSGLTYVGDLHPLIYYQSLTAMNLVRTLAKNRRVGDRVLVVADPVFEMKDLRAQGIRQPTRIAARENNRPLSLMAAIEDEDGSVRELKRLERTSDLASGLENLYGSSCDVHTGFEASKDNFLSKIGPTLDRYRSIVFATHGFAGNQIVGLMEPALALTMVPHGTDGFLTISEVAGLRINADLAALTACQTGTGARLAGEGVMSMGRAFQCAGAKSVLMSLWSVAEESSILLVAEFFKRLKTGQNKLDAWKQARSEVRKAGFEHPFFWGAFILVGEAD